VDTLGPPVYRERVTREVRVKVLVVGAGAVGQVFGRALQRGGAELSFSVKAKYAVELEDGVPFYALRRRSERVAERFGGFGVLTSPDEVAAVAWDQVWLCVSSVALQSAAIAEVLEASGSATVVFVTPGPEDLAWLSERVAPERLVQAAVPFMAYHAPLEGEQVPAPGVACWVPPLARVPCSGVDRGRVDGVMRRLRAGGLRATRVADAGQWASVPSALMMPLITALDLSGWRFERLRRERWLGVAAAGARECLHLMAARFATSAPFWTPLVRPLGLSMALRGLSWVAPFDAETYLRVHFSKVRDQSRYLMETYVELGASAGLPVVALRDLTASNWPA
jgi:2-dehydropantoate 2-reductase